ncbi:hypothetical protein LTR48_003485 [Friedmanniomyces endolithicus]|uniref:Uncharacterized protein n=1 Tax=Rachicladosporium monterosium TaxID=1507873 RepID=A0ABR0L8C1_9PEZI|nr:hypothetical protein LTR29_003652 [Friedmanniomyces endolithicus]KAK1086531.1 hypothetical protein LTR48_003485 [Friedmanniomyces endolithicus]KAK1823894.1 hypothetical protein LTR12_001636 [Friedmanniomyces endolithicus]KAK5145054.1 hypothetical protein LTR32_003114 [Rachicladosporium monterosium]
MQYTIFTRVFVGIDSAQLTTKLEASGKDLLRPIELLLNDNASTAALSRGGVVEKVSSFVTFSTDRARMSDWELAANIRNVPPDQPHSLGMVEANFESLTRDFGDSFDRYSQILTEFRRFDNDIFPLSLIGMRHITVGSLPDHEEGIRSEAAPP